MKSVTLRKLVTKSLSECYCNPQVTLLAYDSVNLSLRSIATSILGGVAWLCFVAAGLAFFFGGRLIHVVFGTERLVAELEGIALTVLCVGVGVIATVIKYRLEEGELPASLGEAINKAFSEKAKK